MVAPAEVSPAVARGAARSRRRTRGTPRARASSISDPGSGSGRGAPPQRQHAAAPSADRQPVATIGRLASINVSHGGVPKRPIPHADLATLGITGDQQRNLKYHGGPLRAVSLYSLERLDRLRREGHPVLPGTLGENLTIEAIDWAEVVPGVRLAIGEAVELEVTSFTVPCRTIQRAFADQRFSRVSQKVHPGWSRVYARVLVPGRVALGDRVAVR